MAFRRAEADLEDFFLELESRASETDALGCLPDHFISLAADLDILVPHIAFGADDIAWDPLSVGLLHEKAGSICTAFRSLLTVQGLVAEAIRRWGTSDQKSDMLSRMRAGQIASICISEEMAGSDIAGIEMTGSYNAGRIVLNGEKKWVTFGRRADILLVLVKIDAEISALLISSQTPGICIEGMPDTLGLRGCGIANIKFADVMVSPSNILGTQGTGLLAVANTALDFGRYSIAWGGLGMAKGCLKDAATYASTRTARGKKLKEFQLIREHLSRMVIGVRTCKEHLNSVAEMRFARSGPSVLETSLAKYACSKLASMCAWRSLQIFGAAGLSSGTRGERFYRDAKILETIEGTSEIHLDALADHALFAADY